MKKTAASTTPELDPSKSPKKVLTTRGVAVWLAAVIAMMLAVTGRTSMGVAGVYALDHFHINAAQLAVFTSVQVGVYALTQIPMGRIIDRYGAKRIILYGGLCMFLGQLILALTSSFSVAIIGRIFIGLGDSTAFLSVMRLLPEWIPNKHAPLFSQLTGSIGQIGQFLSAVPFAALLAVSSWTTSFISLGAISFIIVLGCVLIVRDSPTGTHRVYEGNITEQLRYVFSSPISWQAFFLHWSGFALQATYTLLWAIPLMTLGMGISEATAHTLLVVNTVSTVAFSPLIGMISIRLGYHRYRFNLLMGLLIILSWMLFFLAGHHSMALLILVNIVTAGFGTVSGYGFDNIRERMRPEVIGTATGLANMGGWIGAMIIGQVYGVLLNRHAELNWAAFADSAWFPGIMWLLSAVLILLLQLRINALAKKNAL
ncbi:MAG: MFS transporter [Corynebacterium sp.]|nr:MFS transporter [Corynebacterium sp.]